MACGSCGGGRQRAGASVRTPTGATQTILGYDYTPPGGEPVRYPTIVQARRERRRNGGVGTIEEVTA